MWLITIRSRNSASEHIHTHTPQRIKSRDSNKYLYIHVHSNIIHNIEKMEATQVCIDRWVDKMWYILTMGYCLALKRKELQIHSAVWMDLEDIMLCLNVRHKNINTVWVNLYEVLRGVKFIEVESRVERTSLVAQWVRSHLPAQETRVWSRFWEDPAGLSAVKPSSCNYWAHELKLLKPTCLDPVLHNKRGHRNEKPEHCNEEWPLLATVRESLFKTVKTQHSQK